MPSRSEFYLLPLLMLVLLTVQPNPAVAETRADTAAMVEFRLPASSLADALSLCSRQAGVTLSFDEQLVRGFSVPALSGRFRVEDMLFSLLQGTNLQAIPIGKGGWLIQASKSDDLMVLDKIEVQSRASIKDQMYRESASVNIITRDTIERFRGTSVGDIFQGTPGVLISENRNSGGLDVNIRGMQGQGRVPVLIDGSRQETTVYRGYSGISSRSYIDPDLIGSMRIDKGPVMTADGTGATGGVVSVNTLTAEDVVKPGELSGLRIRLSGIGNNSAAPSPGTNAGYYLPHNAYFSDCFSPDKCTESRTMPERFAPESGMDRPEAYEFAGYAFSLSGAKRYEWGDLVAAYAQREQGNYYAGESGPAPKLIISEPENRGTHVETKVERTGVSRFRGGERIPNTNFSSSSLLLKSNLFLPHDQGLELSYIRYDSKFGEMMPSQIRGFGPARQWLDSEVLNQTYTARYRWQPVENDWADVKFNVWHTDAVTDLNTPGVNSVDLKDNTARKDDYQRWGTDLSNRMLFFPYGELRLDYGIAAQWEDMDTDTPQVSGFYGGSRSGWRNEFSVFTSLRWKPWQQWTFDMGVRHTRFNAKDNNALKISSKDPACKADGQGGCLPIYFRNNHSGSAPVFGLTWEPLKGLQFYARRAEALRMPSLFESTSGWSVSPALDIPLKPEHAINNELGINYMADDLISSDDKFRIKLAYFRNHVNDYLTRTYTNAWEEKKNGDDFFRLRNIKSLDLKGWELNLDYDAGNWFSSISGTRYNLIKVCNIGSFVQNYCNEWGVRESYINNMIPPKWHASANLGGRLLQQKLELGMRATFMGKRTPVPGRAKPGFVEPIQWHSYNLLDVYAKYQINDTTAMDFTVDNVTDRYYLDALSLGLIPAPGRTARLSLNLQF